METYKTLVGQREERGHAAPDQLAHEVPYPRWDGHHTTPQHQTTTDAGCTVPVRLLSGWLGVLTGLQTVNSFGMPLVKNGPAGLFFCLTDRKIRPEFK